jgi:hypothetical protein
MFDAKRMKLTLDLPPPVNQTLQFKDFVTLGVYYVHGSNSNSLEGLSKFRAILSMEEMDGTGWFNKYGILSGERKYTIRGLYQNQPISKGISLNYIQNFRDSLTYAYYGKNDGSYPVLYGFSRYVLINELITEGHPVSNGGINIDMLKAIYVPAEHIYHAKQQLYNLGRVKNIIRPLLI